MDHAEVDELPPIGTEVDKEGAVLTEVEDVPSHLQDWQDGG